nr:CLK4-associating serine/arginine rich protein [Zonotrichia albicollis]
MPLLLPKNPFFFPSKSTLGPQNPPLTPKIPVLIPKSPQNSWFCSSPEQESDERKCNYERYRGLVQNDFAGISEEQCLYQIYIDELYGGLQKPNEDEKKK